MVLEHCATNYITQRRSFVTKSLQVILKLDDLYPKGMTRQFIHIEQALALPLYRNLVN